MPDLATLIKNEKLDPNRRSRVPTSSQITYISFREISPSLDNNDNRSLDEGDLQILAESIRVAGIKEPLRVYPFNDGEFSYKIISGHRRYAAWKYLVENYSFSERETIPCIVDDVPKDEIQEKIDVSQSNLKRNSPKDLQREVAIANSTWQKIVDSGRTEEFKKQLKENFIRRNKDNPKYIEDSQKYINNNYRSRLEFIRAITGLEKSNATVKTIINKTVSGEVNDDEGPLLVDSEEIAEKEEKKANRVVKKEQVNKALTKVIDYLENYCTHNDVQVEVEAKVSELAEFRDSYFQLEPKKKRGRKKKESSIDDVISSNGDSLF
jgi:hypothetical protein